MESPRKQRWRQLQSLFEPGLRRMLVISALLHLLLPTLYNASFLFKSDPVKPPVYRVNLVNKPVKNPQAGRPEAVRVTKPRPKPKPKVKPKPLPPKPKPVKPIPPKPKPKAEPVKPKPAPKVKSKPKPEPKPSVSKAQEDIRMAAMEKFRAKIDKEKAKKAIQDRFADLKAAVSAENQQLESPITDAPPGSVTGKGDKVGIEAIETIRTTIKSNWRYSQYLSSNRNPEAEFRLKYNSGGKLVDYTAIKLSGISAFDESLKRAILKSKDLGQTLPESVDINVIFNLKEMLDQR